MSMRSIKAGEAYWVLTTKNRKFEGGLARAGRTLKRFAIRAAKYFAAIAAAAATYIAGKALNSFKSFEYQLAKVSTMLSDTRHMVEYEKGIKKMAMAFGQSTETLTDGLYQILSAQIDVADAMGVLEVTTKGAIGGFADVGTSSKAVIRILKNYNIESKDASDVSDFLFRIVEKGIINYQDLADSIGKVAPAARGAGLTLNQLGAAITTVLSSEEPQRAMTALRMAIFQAAEDGSDLWSFIEKFRGADLTAISAAGIEKRAAQGILILSNRYEDLNKNLGFMADRTGAADRAFKKMADTQKVGFARIWQSLIVKLSEVGKAFKPLVDSAIPKVIAMIQAMGDKVKSVLPEIIRFTSRFAVGIFETLKPAFHKMAEFGTYFLEMLRVFLIGNEEHIFAFFINLTKLIGDTVIVVLAIAKPLLEMVEILGEIVALMVILPITKLAGLFGYSSAPLAKDLERYREQVKLQLKMNTLAHEHKMWKEEAVALDKQAAEYDKKRNEEAALARQAAKDYKKRNEEVWGVGHLKEDKALLAKYNKALTQWRYRGRELQVMMLANEREIALEKAKGSKTDQQTIKNTYDILAATVERKNAEEDAVKIKKQNEDMNREELAHAEEIERYRQNIDNENLSLQQEYRDLLLQTQFDGIKLAQERLKIEREIAVAKAEEQNLGVGVEQTKLNYDLKETLLNKSTQDMARTVRGMFAIAGPTSFSGSGSEETRQLKELRNISNSSKDTARNTLNLINSQPLWD